MISFRKNFVLFLSDNIPIIRDCPTPNYCLILRCEKRSMFLMKGSFVEHRGVAESRLLWAALLNFGITGVQFVGGIVSGSLSLLSDAVHNMNIRAAYLHLLGYTLSSVAEIIGNLIVWKTGVLWPDLLVAGFISVYIFSQTLRVLKASLKVQMQSVPGHLDVKTVCACIDTFEPVQNVHHVHVWKLGDQEFFFKSHVNLSRDLSVSETMEIQRNIASHLKEKFNILHLTLQFEWMGCPGTGIFGKDDHQKEKLCR